MNTYTKSAVLASLMLLISAASFAHDKASTLNSALTNTHSKISKRYKAVSHIKAEDVATMNADDYLIFDIREQDEFALSHIKNAIWVDPSIDSSGFYEQFNDQIEGKTLILYCSVGVRSSRLAKKLMAAETKNKPTQIYNLENGIFGWHNESRPLFQSNQPTDFVHPYNRIWGRMVNRKNLRRYK